jgi:hypothetical protein
MVAVTPRSGSKRRPPDIEEVADQLQHMSPVSSGAAAEAGGPGPGGGAAAPGAAAAAAGVSAAAGAAAVVAAGRLEAAAAAVAAAAAAGSAPGAGALSFSAALSGGGGSFDLQRVLFTAKRMRVGPAGGGTSNGRPPAAPHSPSSSGCHSPMSVGSPVPRAGTPVSGGHGGAAAAGGAGASPMGAGAGALTAGGGAFAGGGALRPGGGALPHAAAPAGVAALASIPPLMLPPSSHGMGFHFSEPDYAARSQSVNALMQSTVNEALGLS